MTDAERPASNVTTEQRPALSLAANAPTIEDLVSEIVAGKVSLMDLLGAAPTGDYFAFVHNMRLVHVVLRDLRTLKALQEELQSKIREAGGDHSNGEIERELARKDGRRRFTKLLDERYKAFEGQSSLLTGDNFERCLEQYKSLLAHVENMWGDACRLYHAGNYPMATFLAILVIEETGKLSRLPQDLMAYDSPRASVSVAPVDKSHRRKHFIGVVSGALINARLDRVLGKDVVKKVLHIAESGELERIRQSCLYIDVVDGKVVTPSQAVDMNRARIFTVLAGELMAEVLGYFPWEFERMLEAAIAFERAIGIPEAKIARW